MTSLKLLKEKAPLVICITNDVVKNFTANGLVALGASPAMSCLLYTSFHLGIWYQVTHLH